jgi:hypothetical protein
MLEESFSTKKDLKEMELRLTVEIKTINERTKTILWVISIIGFIVTLPQALKLLGF